MPIVGDHPARGVRFVLERPAGSEAPWVYRGEAFTPDARHPLEVHVAKDGTVRVGGSEDLPGELAEKVRLLFRTLHRQAGELPGGAPPLKVVRWRGDK